MKADWDEIQSVFAQALELESLERERFLANRCGGQETPLWSEVDALLRAHEGSGLFLDEPALPTGNRAAIEEALHPEERAEEPAPDLDGERAGPYVIRRPIASGGMGTVYLARHADDELGIDLALKVMKRGMDSAEMLRRFHAERELLARLEHANIARIFDAGSLEDGRPFYVMEYIAGEPLTRACDARELALDERLALFETVCDAVQYAHGHLVVHRDLKPANVLLAGDVPKLLDFGIAKVLTEGVASGLTSRDERRFTYEYASPEHILGRPVSTAADIYSLGVMLY